MNLSEIKTAKNTSLQVNLALNYGSKTEILNDIKKMNKNNEKINEKNFKKYIKTQNKHDPDLLIRTENTKRISNILLWQVDYKENYFEKKL